MSEKEKPSVFHLSLRLAGVNERGELPNDFRKPTHLGIAIYLIFGVKEKIETCHEYTMVIPISQKQYDKAMAGEVIIQDFTPDPLDVMCPLSGKKEE